MNESVKILRNVISVIGSNYRVIILFIVYICFLSGCASTPKSTDPDLDPIDPHEKINRASYDFTDKVDRAVFEPIVNAYIDYVPNAAQRSIGNFYDNLSYPNVVLNSFFARENEARCSRYSAFFCQFNDWYVWIVRYGDTYGFTKT